MVVGDPAVLEAAAIGVPDDLKGESLWVFVVLRAGRDADDALRDAAARACRRAPGPVVPARGGSVHDGAPEDAQREGAAPRDPRGRDGRHRPATCPDSKIPAALDAIAAAH